MSDDRVGDLGERLRFLQERLHETGHLDEADLIGITRDRLSQLMTLADDASKQVMTHQKMSELTLKVSHSFSDRIKVLDAALQKIAFLGSTLGRKDDLAH